MARARRVNVVHANRATHANLHGVGNNVVMPVCCNLIIMSLSTGVPERQFCAISWRGVGAYGAVGGSTTSDRRHPRVVHRVR